MPHGSIHGSFPPIAIAGAIFHVMVVGGFFYFAYHINKSLKCIADALAKKQ